MVLRLPHTTPAKFLPGHLDSECGEVMGGTFAHIRHEIRETPGLRNMSCIHKAWGLRLTALHSWARAPSPPGPLPGPLSAPNTTENTLPFPHSPNTWPQKATGTCRKSQELGRDPCTPIRGLARGKTEADCRALSGPGHRAGFDPTEIFFS